MTSGVVEDLGDQYWRRDFDPNRLTEGECWGMSFRFEREKGKKENFVGAHFTKFSETIHSVLTVLSSPIQKVHERQSSFFSLSF